MIERERGSVTFRRKTLAGWSVSLVMLLCLQGCVTHPAASPAKETAASDFLSRLLAQSTDVGPTAPSRSVWLMLGLHDRNAGREQQYLSAVYDPRSPSFQNFLTPTAYKSTYGAAADEAWTVTRYLQSQRLNAEWSPGDSWVSVSGPANLIERVFAANIHDYVSPRGIRFYASLQDLTVPAQLRKVVTFAGRVTNYAQPRLRNLAGAVPAGGLRPADLLLAYDMTPLRTLGFDGRGETVVFVEPDKQSYRQEHLNAFTDKFGLPPMHVVDRGIPSEQLDPGLETEMDLEVVHEIAPAANLVLYNSMSEFQALFDVQKRVVDENPGAIVSQSWGWCEPAWGSALIAATDELYSRADLLGESVFVSSGDSGAYTCLEAAGEGTVPSDQYLGGGLPCTAPGVTCVGGTRIGVRADGSYYNETVWEEPPLTEGSGGGLSQYYSLPAWQTGPGVLNRYSTNKREFPDVSADADASSGAAIYVPAGWQTGGGTSQSAPILAGMAALLNQFLKQQGIQKPIGFVNPAFYALAAHPSPYAPFHDVTVGTNLYYPATPGYDLATGLGTPDVWNLARDLFEYLRAAG